MIEGQAGIPHRAHEDVVAILTGTSMVAFGVMLFSQATLITGGTSGIALLLHYATGIGFGPLFFAVNLPFYALSLWRLGMKLTVRTFIGVALVSAMTAWFPGWIAIDRVDPLFAALIGGVFIGIGLLALFRHRTSLGGVNIVAIYAQEIHGLRAGYVQFGIDTLILAAALFVLEVRLVMLSILGSAVINLTLAFNHRSGRYLGFS